MLRSLWCFHLTADDDCSDEAIDTKSSGQHNWNNGPRDHVGPHERPRTMRPYQPKTSAIMRIKIMTTKKAGLLSIGTDSSITDNAALSMPMVRPAAKSSYRHPLWGRHKGERQRGSLGITVVSILPLMINCSDEAVDTIELWPTQLE